MYKTIFKYLEDTEKKYPNKIAFADNKREVSYKDFVKESKMIASNILKYNLFNKPIAVFLDKNVYCLSSMMGINYSGNFYTIIDNKMPAFRIDNIFDTLKPSLVITDNKNKDKLNDLKYNVDIMLIDELDVRVNQSKLDKIYDKIIDTNPMYILFTSGSTGVPKGVTINHRATISYISWFNKAFNIGSKTTFGSQTPFYFSMSVSDIFSTMTTGATFYIIPKVNFSFPVRLIEYLNDKKINTIYWVPSALCIVANMGTFKVIKPKYLKKVLFAGEVMPMKQLNMWIKALPKVMFANLFGPTETVDICSYYIVNRKFKDSDTLPIGSYCDNCDLMVVSDNKVVGEVGVEGELYVRGSFLASGYYNNSEKTHEMFVQNPLNNSYPELVYKTGDIVKYNDLGELLYVTRADFQIKHMGYRIELGEIESATSAIKDVDSCVCIYDKEKDNIVLFYVSKSLSDMEVLSEVKKKVPNYMWPQVLIKIESMPYNANGKIDRKKLSSDYKEGKYKNE